MGVNKSLSVVLLVTLIGTIGIALPYPVLSPLFLDAGQPISEFAGIDPYWLLGLSLAVYPLGVLMGASRLGALSDRLGRKPVLTITLLAAALTNVLAAVSLMENNYLLFITARWLTGLLEGNISVARAIVTDLCDQIDKTIAFSYIGAASFAGWFIGPLLGGYTVGFGFATPFFIAAALCLIGAFYVWMSLVETVANSHHFRQREQVLFWHTPNLKCFIFIQFVLMFAINIFYEFYPVYLVSGFQSSPQVIADVTMMCTLAMVLTSIYGVPRLSRGIHWPKQIFRQRIYTLGGVCSGISIALVAWPDSAYGTLPIFFLTGVAIACLNDVSYAWFSDQFSTLNQGRLMGVLVATFCVANVLAAVVGSIMAKFNTALLLVAAGGCAVAAGAYYHYAVRSAFTPNSASSVIPEN